MTFADTKRVPETTVVFFPACLAGSLDDALKRSGLTDYKIIKTREAREKYGVDCTRDENGAAAVPMYDDMPGTTDQVRALVSNFDADQVRTRIYALHDDPDAIAYKDSQAALVQKAFTEDGMV